MTSDIPHKNEVVILEDDRQFSLSEVGADANTWLVLRNTLFPDASKGAAAAYLRLCKARGLDPMKKPFHIVAFKRRVKEGNGWVEKQEEQIIPSVNEMRVTAMRTGQYAGNDAVVFGPMLERTFTSTYQNQTKEATVRFPEWAQMTVYRKVGNEKMQFHGPRVYFLETYARAGGDMPNQQWAQRPSYMLDKCAEAAALRRAFPEEIGNEPSVDEVEGQTFDGEPAMRNVTEQTARIAPMATLTNQLRGSPTLAAENENRGVSDVGSKETVTATTIKDVTPETDDKQPSDHSTDGVDDQQFIVG